LESKGTFFILIIVVAVLALTLAALAGYLFLVQGTSNSSGTAVASEATVKEVPKEEDLVKIPLYADKSYFNLKNDDPNKIAMMQVNVTLKCYKTLKEKENKKVIVEEKIDAYSDEIKELVSRFFLSETLEDVKNLEVMDQAKEELRKQINELLNEGNKHPEDIVYKVIFSQWLFQ
jgi:flagellar basal body-associated protein FliL